MGVPQPSPSASTIPEPHAVPHADPYRYVCACFFVLAALINSWPTNTLTSASATAEDIYSESKALIALCSLADNLMIPFVLFQAIYLLDHVGLKAGMNVAGAAMCIGSILRLGINWAFGVYVLGTFVTTVGSIILLSAPIKFVSSWFPVRQVQEVVM